MSLSADPSAFVVKAEEYGVPQARHRIFVLGVRNDIDIMPRILEKVSTRTTVKDVIGDLPKIRSGLSKQADSSNRWVETPVSYTHLDVYKRQPYGRPSRRRRMNGDGSRSTGSRRPMRSRTKS